MELLYNGGDNANNIIYFYVKPLIAGNGLQFFLVIGQWGLIEFALSQPFFNNVGYPLKLNRKNLLMKVPRIYVIKHVEIYLVFK